MHRIRFRGEKNEPDMNGNGLLISGGFGAGWERRSFDVRGALLLPVLWDELIDYGLESLLDVALDQPTYFLLHTLCAPFRSVGIWVVVS